MSEMPSEGQFKAFVTALGQELRADILSGNSRGAMATRGFMRHAARLHARNLLTFEGFSFPDPEHEVEAVTFTDEERKAILEVRATQPRFYLPAGETIRGQLGSRDLDVYPEGYTEEDGTNRLRDFPSRRIEVAIWADEKNPEEFFIKDSFDKTTGQQDKLRIKEAEALSKRPGLSGVTIIRPEAPEVTEVMFQLFDTTGIRLLGEKWRDKDGLWRYIRTSTPINKSGSSLAYVGHFAADGPRVGDWFRGKGSVYLGDAFWVVPNRSR